jgi:NADPH:quinone reductase-like Zn-dependent oxidoreductase
MKAACVDRYGPPEGVVVREMPDAVVGPNDVLIRQMASTVTPADTAFRAADPVLKPGGIYLTTVPSLAILGHMMRRRRPDGTRARLATTGLRPTAETAKDMVVLKQFIEAGVLRGVIDRTYRLAEIAQAHRYVELGSKAGDVIVTIP